jgi:hypothetical protein
MTVHTGEGTGSAAAGIAATVTKAIAVARTLKLLSIEPKPNTPPAEMDGHDGI